MRLPVLHEFFFYIFREPRIRAAFNPTLTFLRWKRCVSQFDESFVVTLKIKHAPHTAAQHGLGHKSKTIKLRSHYGQALH